MLLGLLLSALTVFWVVLLLGAGRWGEGYRLDPWARVEGPAPKLSVCVPARDEAGRIGDCVRAALALDYEPLEVIVVDDRSSDGTADEARAAGGGDDRLVVVDGTEPAPGWAGKPAACVRAAGAATGELLLFVDADVRLAPWSAAAAVTHLVEHRLALLSLFGDWELVGFWERVLVPVIGWFIRGSVDLAGVKAQHSAFANGQFILVDRAAYDAAGGHEAVKAEVLDDVRLAQAFVAADQRIAMLHAPGSFRVRLYESLSDIVSGYAKNLYEGMDRNPIVAGVAVVFITVTTLLPWALLPSSGWAAAVCALMLLFRHRLERADGRSGWLALTHPLGNLVFVGVLLRSVFGSTVAWKGRTFVGGKVG